MLRNGGDETADREVGGADRAAADIDENALAFRPQRLAQPALRQRTEVTEQEHHGQREQRHRRQQGAPQHRTTYPRALVDAGVPAVDDGLPLLG